MSLKQWLGEKLTRVYGSSVEEEDERTRRTVDAVRNRAETRERELGITSEDYSRSVVDAYRSQLRGGDRAD